MHAHPRSKSHACTNSVHGVHGGWVSGRWGLSFRVFTRIPNPLCDLNFSHLFPPLFHFPLPHSFPGGGGKNFSKKLGTYSGGLKGFNSGEDMDHLLPVARGPHKGGGPQVRACRASLVALHSPLLPSKTVILPPSWSHDNASCTSYPKHSRVR